MKDALSESRFDCRKLLISEDESTRLSLPSPGSDECLSFFFGGVGDARHVFLTLMDLHHKRKEECLVTSGPTVDIVMNDIHRSVLARLSVMLYLAAELGKYSSADITSNLDAATVASTMMYTYMGAVMPPAIYQLFKQSIQTISGMTVAELEEKTMLRVSESDWEQTKETLLFWLEPADCDTETLLKRYTAKLDPMKLNDAEMSKEGERAANSVREAREQKLQQLLAVIDSMSDEELLQVSGGSPVDREQMKRKMAENLSQDDDMIADQFSMFFEGTRLECQILYGKKFLLPRRVLAEQWEADNPSKLPLLLEHIAIGESDGDPNIKHVAKRIGHFSKSVTRSENKTWVANPTSSSGRSWSDMRFDPIQTLGSLWVSPWLRAPKGDGSSGSIFLSHIASTWLFHLSEAVNCLKGKDIQLKFMLGGMNQILERIRLDDKMKFDRIFLSNVPDYTGILYNFITVTPLLKDDRSTFQSNVLHNTGKTIGDKLDHSVNHFSWLNACTRHAFELCGRRSF